MPACTCCATVSAQLAAVRLDELPAEVRAQELAACRLATAAIVP